MHFLSCIICFSFFLNQWSTCCVFSYFIRCLKVLLIIIQDLFYVLVCSRHMQTILMKVIYMTFWPPLPPSLTGMNVSVVKFNMLHLSMIKRWCQFFSNILIEKLFQGIFSGILFWSFHNLPGSRILTFNYFFPIVTHVLRFRCHILAVKKVKI